MGRERLEIEFGRHAGWIVEAIEAHGLDAIPAACRGAGDPTLFGVLADAMGARPGALVLDVGCGIGGPGAWLASERRCDVVGIDVMEEPVRGLKRLFPRLRTVVATSRALPFRNETFDATWAIGVIETIAHKSEALRELSRVLVPEGRLAAYTFVSTESRIDDAPMADRFQPLETLVEDFESGGFRILNTEPTTLAGPPAAWRDAQNSALAHANRLHRDDPAHETVDRERQKFARLFTSGEIQAWVIIGAKEDP
ncbi:MAG: class I SAM-dependent methyltransferase [Actinomycetota bacterium]